MATPQTMEEAKAELQRLQNALANGEIDLAEYGQKVGPIIGLMNTALQLETQIERPIGLQTTELTLQQPDLERQAKFAQLQRETELAALGGVKEDLSEQAKRATEKIERELYPQRFATKEFDEPISPAAFVSRVRDPVKGLVRDAKTGELRKAGFLELLGEGIKRQVLQTPRSKAEIEEEYASQRRKMAQDLKKRGVSKERITELLSKYDTFGEDPLSILVTEGIPLLAEETKRLKDFLPEAKDPITSGIRALGETFERDRIQDEERTLVVESPFEWGLRTLTNSGSAALAPLIKGAQDIVSTMTGAPVSTRKGAGYKKTEREELGMQFITNFLLNQGVMSQQQAQLFPADENYDGLLNIATQGSTGSVFITGLAGEIGAPITALGVPFEALKLVRGAKRLASKPLRSAKSVRAQKIGNAINNPIEFIRYSGQRAEIDAALRTADEGLTAQKLEQEIVDQGGVINRSSLREKAAQRTGDIAGSIAVLKTAVEIGEKLKAPAIVLDNLKVPQSSFLKGFFEGKPAMPIQTVKDKIKNLETRFTNLPKKGDEIVVLRRVNQVSEDTRNVITKQDFKPKTDAKIIDRNIKKARWFNEDIWKAVEDNVPFNLYKKWDRGRDLTLKSFQTPLNVQEIIELGDVWKSLDNAKVWDTIPDNLRTYKNVYESVRGSVSDVMRDNFLRNIPDDLIYVSSDVAVPIKAIQKPEFNVYKSEIQKSLQFTPSLKGEEVVYTLSPQSISNINTRTLRTGLQVPRNIDLTKPLTQLELQTLTNVVSSDLALELLDGVRLKTGTLTSQMALIPSGTARQNLIGTGTTKGQFRLKAAGLANAIRLIINDGSLVKNMNGSLFSNLSNMKNSFFAETGIGSSFLTPGLQRFSDDVRRAHNAAIDQSLQRYKDAARSAKPGQETQAFNQVLLEDLDIGVQQYITKLNESTIRENRAISDLDMFVFSDKSQKTQRVNVLNKKYTSEQVREFMKQQNIGSTYDDLLDNIEFIEDNMSVVIENNARMQQWKKSLEDFFTSGPVNKNENRLKIKEKYIQYVEDLVRVDKSVPFWTPNNILPLTIENFKEVIELIRTKDNVLRKVGLSNIKTLKRFEQEYFVLPLLARSFEIRRLQNMQESIDVLINESPDIFLDLRRATNDNPGLKNTENLVDKLEDSINETLELSVREDIISQDSVNIIAHQIKEILFDGLARDIWTNSSRDVQKLFIKNYLDKMILDKTPVVLDMDRFIMNLYDNGILKSKTFARIDNQFQKIFEKIEEGFVNKFSELKQNVNSKEAIDQLLRQNKIIQDLQENLPQIFESAKLDYLRGLTLGTDGIYDSLFGQQLDIINRYFAQYGANSESLAYAVTNMSPRFEYIGSQNIGLIYGIDMQKQIDNVLEIVNGSSTSDLSKYIETLANYKQKSPLTNTIDYIFYYLHEGLALTRRWAIANMLGGVIDMSLRYFSTNTFTQPAIYLTTLGARETKAGSFAKFTGISFTGGLTALTEKPRVSLFETLSNQKFSTGVKSNQFLYAPADKVIIKASPGGAIRDFTAGELRDLMQQYNVEYSRADIDFFDTQFQRFLIDVKLNPDGSSRYGSKPFKISGSIAKRLWDNLSPSRRNIFTELNKIQDSQLRRYVFIESLESGETIAQAADKASRSILNYGSLTDTERKYILPYIYFYSFARTMGAEVINSFARYATTGNNIPFRVLQIQNAINKQVAEDYVDQQDSLKKRFFNIYIGTTDGVDLYAGGMMNPQVDMFDNLCRASLVMMSGAFETDPRIVEQENLISRLAQSLMNVGSSGLENFARGNPFLGLVLDNLEAQKTGRPIPFPQELIIDAEITGRLPELIKMYGLEERKYKTPGRAISFQGKYYDFPRTKKGLEKYSEYLIHRALGLTAFNMIAYRGGYLAAQSRGQKERTKANIYAQEDLTIIDPNDPSKTIVIKDFTSFAKSIGRGDQTLSPNLLYTFYRLGQTPMKSVPVEQVEERILRNINRTLKDKLPKKE